MFGLCVGGLLWAAVCITAVSFDMNGYETRVVCLQGLSNCSVSDDLPMDPPFGSEEEEEEEVVDVQGIQARAQLCCKHRRECKLCLVVELRILVHPQLDMSDRDHAEDEDKGAGGGGRTNGQRASVRVCCTESILPVCKRVWFTLHPDDLPLSNTTQLSLVSQPLCVTYGSRALLSVHPSSSAHPYLELSMPSLDQVCSLDRHESIEECEVPRIKTIVDRTRSRLELHVGASRRGLRAVVCLQYERNGGCQIMNTTTIPLSAVTTCMCLQAWWHAGDQMSRRAMSCPFTNHTGVLIQRNAWKNLSVSLALVDRNKVLLLWNLSTPCRLDAQVWPCRRGEVVPHHGCREMTGLRKKLSKGNWRQNKEGHWEIQGAFEDFDLRFPPCVMVKVKGMEYELGPFCIDNVSRWRWSLLIAWMVPLFFLAVLILCFQHNRIKRWANCWHSGKYMQTVRGHVVVLSPPDSDSDSGVCELVCALGSFLREQGLGVTVDQWSRAELCSLGPLPWLYAQLLHLEQRGGGKVVLVLTCGAWQKAQEWTHLYGRPRQALTEDRAEGPPPTVTSSCPYSDVFSAALWCVAGDRQLGRARERFLLVDFESCPVQLACSGTRLPELLEGLRLFRLPSQNQAMLSELMGGGNSQQQTAGNKGAARYSKVKEKTFPPGPETVPFT